MVAYRRNCSSNITNNTSRNTRRSLLYRSFYRLNKSLLDAALDDVEPRQSLVTVLRSHNSNVSF